LGNPQPRLLLLLGLKTETLYDIASNMVKRNGEIYMMIFPNGKRYIGQTVQKLERRTLHHFYFDVKNDVLLGRAIWKYGKHNIRIVTIKICEERQLDYFEVKYIRQYGSQTPIGYNIEAGGSGKIGLTDETKMKISLSLKGKKKTAEHAENISRGRQGIIFTEEHKRNISIGGSGERNSHWGVPRTEEQKIAVGDKNRERYLFTRTNPAYVDIPKYIYVRVGAKPGYQVRNHPTLPGKYFVSKKMTMEEKMELAMNYIKTGEE
jgi:group I intron endonuclease